MVEGDSQTPQIEQLKSSLADRGFAVLPLGTENVEGLVQEIMTDPTYHSISGTKRLFELVNDDFPTQEVTVFFDKEKIEPVEIPLFGADEEEEKEDDYAARATIFSSLGYPIVYIDVPKDKGEPEKRTVYFRPKRKGNNNDLARQTA